jgi:hypothetical protein
MSSGPDRRRVLEAFTPIGWRIPVTRILAPQRTLHRYAIEVCEVGRGLRGTTVRVDDGEPGDELQAGLRPTDFGYASQPAASSTRGLEAHNREVLILLLGEQPEIFTTLAHV